MPLTIDHVQEGAPQSSAKRSAPSTTTAIYERHLSSYVNLTMEVGTSSYELAAALFAHVCLQPQSCACTSKSFPSTRTALSGTAVRALKMRRHSTQPSSKIFYHDVRYLSDVGIVRNLPHMPHPGIGKARLLTSMRKSKAKSQTFVKAMRKL